MDTWRNAERLAGAEGCAHRHGLSATRWLPGPGEGVRRGIGRL